MKTNQITATLLQFYNRPVAQVSLELFLSLGAVIFFALFAIRPTMVTMSDLIKEIDDKKAFDQKLSQKIAALSTVQTQYLSLENRLSVLDQAIPSSPKFEEAIRIIEKLASQNKLVINSMQVSEIPSEPISLAEYGSRQRESLPISINVIGEYSAIRTFVENLKNNRRSLIVDSIIFSVNEERNQKQLSATITINMQYFASKK